MLSESIYSTLHEWGHVLVEPRWPNIDSLCCGACVGAMLSESTYSTLHEWGHVFGGAKVAWYR
jgi:hypothetical protein